MIIDKYVQHKEVSRIMVNKNKSFALNKKKSSRSISMPSSTKELLVLFEALMKIQLSFKIELLIGNSASLDAQLACSQTGIRGCWGCRASLLRSTEVGSWQWKTEFGIVEKRQPACAEKSVIELLYLNLRMSLVGRGPLFRCTNVGWYQVFPIPCVSTRRHCVNKNLYS